MELNDLISNLEFENESIVEQEKIINEIIKYYNEEITLNELADNLYLKKNKIRNQLPRLKVNKQCEVCKCIFSTIIPLRRSLEFFVLNYNSKSFDCCEKCGHFQNRTDICNCEYCYNIKLTYFIESFKDDYDRFIDTSFENLVNLLILVQFKSLDFNKTEFTIDKSEYNKLSEIFEALRKENIVVLSLNNDVKNLNWNKQLKYEYSKTNVKFTINSEFLKFIGVDYHKNNSTLKEVLLELIRGNYKEVIFDFISNLIVDEMVDLFLYLLIKYRKVKEYKDDAVFTKDKKEVKILFKELYKDFTPNQIYFMSYSTMSKEAANKNSKLGQYQYRSYDEISIKSILNHLSIYCSRSQEYIKNTRYSLPAFRNDDTMRSYLIEHIFGLENWFYSTIEENTKSLFNYLSDNALFNEQSLNIAPDEIKAYKVLDEMLFLQYKNDEHVELLLNMN